MAETGTERKIAGKDVLFFIDPTSSTPRVWSLVVCLTEQSMSIVNDKLDAATKCGPDTSVGKQTIDISIAGMQIFSAASGRSGINELLDLSLNGSTFAWKYGEAIPTDGSVLFDGTGFLSNLELSSGLDENSTFSASLGVFGTPTKTEVDVPDAPTGGVVDNTANTFDWTNVAGYSDVADYETTVDAGETWITAVAKPLTGLTGTKAIGSVGVRVAGVGVTPASEGLFNATPYS